METRLEFVSAASKERDPRRAIREILTTVETELGAEVIDLAVIFISPHFLTAAEVILREVQRVLKPRVLTGCAGEGVIGSDEEFESIPAISLMAARLPGVHADTRALRASDLHRALGDPRALFEGIDILGSTRLIVLTADPFSINVNRILDAFNDAHPGIPVVGGMANPGRAPGRNALFSRGDVSRDGAVITVLSGALDIDIIVSQGCRSVGPVYRVTEVRDNVVVKLDDSAPLDQLRTVVENLSAEERGLLRNGIFLGRAIDSGKEMLGRGDFLVRGIVGADPKSGTLTAGDILAPGEVVQFHLRDARTAKEDLELMLTPHALFGTPRGALLFSCNGRGIHLYDHPHGDISVVQRFFPGLSVAGFFCAGEIGPIGGRNFVHGHTAILAMIRPPAR